MNLARLAIVVALGLFALDATHDAAAGGSFLAVAVAVLLVLAHGGLLRRGDEDASPFSMKFFAPVVAVALLAAMASGFLLASTLYEEPFLPKRAAPLGGTLLLAERVGDGIAPYRTVVPMAGFEADPAAAPGMVLALFSLQSWGLDPRWVTILGFLMAQGALLAVAFLAQWRGASRERVLAPLVLSLVLSFSPRLLELAQSAQHPLHWLFIVLFALSLGVRWVLPAALSLGLLATMSPGWLVLLPLGGMILWKQHRWRCVVPLCLAAGLLLVFFGLFYPDTFELWQGMVGSAFVDGSPWRDSPPNLWVRPTLAAPLQWANALALGSVLAVTAVGFGTWRIARGASPKELPVILALCAGAVIAFVPGTFAMQWMGHGLLLALLSAMPDPTAEDAVPPKAWGVLPLLLLLVSMPAAMRVWGGPIESLDRAEGMFQAHTAGLRGEWNTASHDHLWGAGRTLDVTFPMALREPGTLLTRVGFLGGDFTPYNETRVLLNGRLLGRIRLLPGAVEPVAIPVADGMLLRRGMNTLTFECAWTRSPQSLGLGDDARDLSMIYYGLQWVPMTSMHPRDIPATRLIP